MLTERLPAARLSPDRGGVVGESGRTRGRPAALGCRRDHVPTPQKPLRPATSEGAPDAEQPHE